MGKIKQIAIYNSSSSQWGIHDLSPSASNVILNNGSDAETAINSKFSITGGEITGASTFSGITRILADVHNISGSFSKWTDYNVDTSPSETKYTSAYRIVDINGKLISVFGTRLLTNGDLTTRIHNQRILGNSTVYNDLNMTITDDGTRTVEVSDPAAWRAALGVDQSGTISDDVVLKAGSTMDGMLTVQRQRDVLASGLVGVQIYSENLNSNSTTTAATGGIDGSILRYVSRDNQTIGMLGPYSDSNNNKTMRLVARRQFGDVNKYVSVGIGITSDSNAIVTFGYSPGATGLQNTLAEAFRTALDVRRANTYSPKTGKPTGNQSPGFGKNFIISQVSQDATGQITLTDRNVKIPNTLATSAAAGLMSSEDKTRVDDMWYQKSGACTPNSTYVEAGDCRYYQFGRIVVVTVNNLKLKAAATVNRADPYVLFTGLPHSQFNGVYGMLTPLGSSTYSGVRVRFVENNSSSHKLQIIESGTLSTNPTYIGNFVYMI